MGVFMGVSRFNRHPKRIHSCYKILKMRENRYKIKEHPPQNPNPHKNNVYVAVST